jgi:pimeloyl-ACP methyl ester carboxylesterase
MPLRSPVPTRLRVPRWAALATLLLVLGVIAAACSSAGGGVETEEFQLEANDGYIFPAEFTQDTIDELQTWVLLGHQFTGNLRDWDSLRDDLVVAGFAVLTWDFRCHGVAEDSCETDTKGESVLNIWREWNAALDWAIEQGAGTIYGMGASMGGTSLMQVAADRPEIQAAAAVSSPNRFKGLDALENFDRVTVPKLFIAGNFDMAAPDFSRRYQAAAVPPSRLVILETELHGTTLVQSPTFGSQVRRRLVDFALDPADQAALASIDPGPVEEEPEQAEAEPQQAIGEVAPDQQSPAEQPTTDESTDPLDAAQQTEPSASATAQDTAPPEDQSARPPIVKGDPETVTLRTDDGLLLTATLLPAGDIWVLLAHQLRDSRDGWGALDDQLHDDGYSILAWDFRDHGDSPNGSLEQISLDWLAAIDFAQDNGAAKIYGVGASMGGTSLLVVAADDPRVDGVVTISAPAIFFGFDGAVGAAALNVPLLIIAGINDSEARAGADVIRRAADSAGVEWELVIYVTGLHGNSLVRDGNIGREVYRELIELLPNPDGAA